MDNYRPDYGLPYNYPPPPPPIHAMPPLPPGPPPSYDPHRGGDSYRPPQSDFSYRNNGSAPQPPKEWEPFRPTRSRGYAMRENGRSRPGNNDNVNLNQARRRNNYRPRQNFRTAPADRPLLRHHDQANSSEEMLGMTNGQRFMAAEDISDSEEEQMDESESELDERETNEVDLLAMREGNDTTQIVDEPHEPPSKRRALTSNSNTVTNGTSEPKWSNPDPYTVLPPVDEATRKRKDVVKLIRKARREAEEIAEEHNQVAANDDFISFGMDENAGAEPASPRMDDQNGSGRGVPGAPSGPRSFSHLHNLHSQEVPRAPEVSIQTDSANKLGPSPQTSPEFPKIPEETVLDLGRNSAQSVPAFGGDENLGNRKRTRDDSIKGQKKGSPHNNGSILHDWRPASGMDPIPWLSRTSLITANAGFRLHKEICDFYNFVQPKDFEQTVRQELLTRLQDAVTYHLPNTSVICFGSFAAGLYLPNADMDVVIVSSSFLSSGRKVACQSNNQMWRFARYLEDSGVARRNCEVITTARVPIIKFIDRVTNIKVDVSFENETGITANSTFTGWKEQYPAMPVLVTVIKQFLMMRGLNEVQHGGLGGFSVTCLVTSLLQNMPRVQSGDLIPEQHLGEMFLEFLDLYGNRLDTTRSGISMRPPGYFEKQQFGRSNKRGGVYQGNKASRLAIIDPNKPDNDISGGSREVMLIFDRFAKAHAEILQAMKSPGRVSLLDWSLGGNYESFASQRSHLLGLYREKWGSPRVVPASSQLRELGNSGNEPLDSLRGEDSLQSDDTAMSTTSRPAESALDTVKPTKSARRAARLRAQYPDMEEIPDCVSRPQEVKLVAKHVANGGRPAQMKPAAPKNLPKAQLPKAHLPKVQLPKGQLPKGQLSKGQLSKGQPSKGESRAHGLKRSFPDMVNVPKSISKKQRQSMVESYKAVKKAAPQDTTQMQNGQLTQLPERPVPTPQQPFPRRDIEKRPVSNKMAPLSNARRAEVARNLSGNSNDDPIALD